MARMNDYQVAGEDNYVSGLTELENDLLFILIDASGSMEEHNSNVSEALRAELVEKNKDIDDACHMRAARADFGEGYYLINKFVEIKDFNTRYRARNEWTDLYGSIVKAAEFCKNTIEEKEGYTIRMQFVVFTDGAHNTGGYSLFDAANAVEELNSLGVLTTIVDFGYNNQDVIDSLGFQVVRSCSNNKKELFGFVKTMSSSFKSQSQKGEIDPSDWNFGNDE